MWYSRPCNLQTVLPGKQHCMTAEHPSSKGRLPIYEIRSYYLPFGELRDFSSIGTPKSSTEEDDLQTFMEGFTELSHDKTLA